MLAVVDDEQEPTRCEVAIDDVVEVGPIDGAQAPDVGDGRQHDIRVGDRCELRDPRAIGKVLEPPQPGFDGQPGLPRPAGPHQRHEPMLIEERLDGGKVRDSTDEGGGFGGEVRGRLDGRAQRREPIGQVGGDDLEHLDRLVEVLEPMRPHSPQRDSVREIRRRQRAGGRRGQCLAAVRQ